MALRVLLENKIRLQQLRNLKPIISTTFSTSTATTKQPPGQQKDSEDVVNNEPIKFFNSQASSWRAKASRSGGADEALWYQPYVISASLGIFLIYFCVLREENDVDLKLGKSLFDHIEGLEEHQLVVMYKYNRENKLDNSKVVARLKELNVDIKAIAN